LEALRIDQIEKEKTTMSKIIIAFGIIGILAILSVQGWASETPSMVLPRGRMGKSGS
jgi:purine-cytosine permease-like protein